MSSQGECLSQRTAFHTAGSHKPIEVKQQSLARVAQIMGTVGQGNETNNSNEYENEFDGDEVDDDLVFSTVPERSTISSTTANIHFDEIDDDEMRRFAESFEQEQQDIKMDDDDDDQLCQDRQIKMQTPTKSSQIENNNTKKNLCIEDLDALLNEDENDNDDDDDNNTDNGMEQQEQMSPVFKKKP